MIKYKLIIVYKNPHQRRDEIYFKSKETANYYKKYYEQNNSIKSLKIIRINETKLRQKQYNKV